MDVLVCQTQQNTVKTANQNSRINFYFVTCFYSLYDICMADGMADGMPSELGVLNFELGFILGFACDFELFSFELEDFVLLIQN